MSSRSRTSRTRQPALPIRNSGLSAVLTPVAEANQSAVSAQASSTGMDTTRDGSTTPTPSRRSPQGLQTAASAFSPAQPSNESPSVMDEAVSRTATPLPTAFAMSSSPATPLTPHPRALAFEADFADSSGVMDVGMGSFLQSTEVQVQEMFKHMQKLHDKLHEMLQKGTLENIGNITAVHKHLEVVDLSFDTKDQTLLMSAVDSSYPVFVEKVLDIVTRSNGCAEVKAYLLKQNGDQKSAFGIAVERKNPWAFGLMWSALTSAIRTINVDYTAELATQEMEMDSLFSESPVKKLFAKAMSSTNKQLVAGQPVLSSSRNENGMTFWSPGIYFAFMSGKYVPHRVSEEAIFTCTKEGCKHVEPNCVVPATVSNLQCLLL